MRFALAVLLLPSLAFAQSVAEPDAGSLFTTFLSALASKNWALLGTVAVLALVWAARTFGAKVIPGLGTPRGGAILSAVGGTAALLVAALTAGQPLTVSLVVGCFWTALSASGLWSVGKNLTAPAPTPQAAPTICTPAEIANGTCKP